MIDKVCRNGLLYDFYGALLTDKQQYCFELHYLRDMSLSEIAGGLTVSRQAVHDILRRAEQLLEDYEDKLQLVSRHQKERKLHGHQHCRSNRRTLQSLCIRRTNEIHRRALP